MMGEYDAGYENCIDSMVRQMEDMQFRIDSLHRENAKLRELVRHLRECTKHNTCALCDYAEDACDFDYDMRELGVMCE